MSLKLVCTTLSLIGCGVLKLSHRQPPSWLGRLLNWASSAWEKKRGVANTIHFTHWASGGVVRDPVYV